MTRRKAPLTQAEMQRAIRAAKAEGVAELEIRLGGETVMIWRLKGRQSTDNGGDELVGSRQFSL
jgi:hypothetical protein